MPMLLRPRAARRGCTAISGNGRSAERRSVGMTGRGDCGAVHVRQRLRRPRNGQDCWKLMARCAIARVIGRKHTPAHPTAAPRLGIKVKENKPCQRY